jgi:hypothetical protein
VPPLLLYLPLPMLGAAMILLRIDGFGFETFVCDVLLPVAVFLLDCTLVPCLAVRLLDLYLSSVGHAGTAVEAAVAHEGRVQRERWSPWVFLLLYALLVVAARAPQSLQAALGELRETLYLLSKTLLDRVEAP